MLQGTTASTATDAIKKGYESMKEAVDAAAASAMDFTSTFRQLDTISAEFVKNTGMGRERTIEMETSITQSATQILKFSEGIMTYEDALKRSAEIVGNISDATGRSLIGNAKEIEGIAVAMEATNVPSEKLVKNFKNAGFSLSSIPKEMQKVTDYTKSIGVNTAEVSGKVVDNLKNLNLYNFDNGVQGLTKMVAQSTLLGVDMTKIFSLSEKLFNPESAIEMAASFQRLGVSTSALLDPLKLMDMGQNNPEELQNQIVEMTKRFTYFDEKNQKFQILPGAQREMREIAGVMGMGADELARMALGSSELGKKMSEIRFPTLDTGPMSEEQKQMIANMSELRDGEYKVMVDQKDAQGFSTGIMEEKSITQLSEEDIKTLSESSKPKKLEDIAKEQLTALQRIAGAVTSTATSAKAGIAGSRIAQAGRGGVYRTESAFADNVGGLVKQGSITKLTDELTTMSKDYFTKLVNGDEKGSIESGKKMENFIKSNLSNGLEKVIEGGLKTFDTAKDEVNKLIHIGNEPAKNTKEQTGIANMIKPEEIKGLVEEMLPDFENFAKQMESGDKKGAEKTGKDIEDQLSKFGMDDKTMKMFTDMVGANTKLTEDEIKTLAKSSQVIENTETKQPQEIKEKESQKSKGSWMTEYGSAFDNVTQGVTSETKSVDNSQVSNLNNQTVTTTNNNQQTPVNTSDKLIDVMGQQPPPQIVEHRFEGTITIKVDAPAGVNSAYVTKTINDMVNSPAFAEKMIKKQDNINNNYGLTGGKISEYSNSSGMGMA